MTEVAWGPWSSAVAMFQGAAPAWVPESEQPRVRSYELYEQMYWSHRGTFKLLQRGTNASPIYIPNPRIIVDTSARYVAKGLGFKPEPQALPGEDQAQADETTLTLAQQWFRAIFDREKFFSRFAANKLYGLMRGDWLFHVTGDPNKMEGRRLSLHTVNPSSYFPQYVDVADPESKYAVILADMVLYDKEYVRRQVYRRIRNTDGSSTITSELGIFATDKWFDISPENPPLTVEGFTGWPETPLPEQIQAIPVYHIPNNPMPNWPWGNSELRGMEVLAGAVNQSISDEELTLVLEGLGVYATDVGPPVDDAGNEGKWVIGPGRVLELNDPQGRFMRVNGVSSVGPYLDHVRYIEAKVGDTTGANEAALGKVDVNVAESGVALALRLSPLLSRVEYMETFITDALVTMWFDIATGFLPAYEGQALEGIRVLPTYGGKLPLNRKEKFSELVQMHQLGVITTEFFLSEMEKLGYTFPDTVAVMAQQAMAEQQARTDAATPSFDQRAAEEDQGGSSTQELIST